VIITRSANNFGPFQFPEKLIPLVITNAMEGKTIPVYGDGLNVRNWLYVEDNCRALAVVLERGKTGEIYNIGGGSELSNLTLIKHILARLDKPESLIKFVPDRPGHDRRYSLDSGKLKKSLGWAPASTFENALDKTIDWYLENRAWWQRVKTGGYLEYYHKQYSMR
jgi:dTDP-glucose 4,6-dehydratase